MASSPNVRPSPNSATGADAESTAAVADAAAASVAASAASTTEAENQVVWKRPNMQGSKCSINGYVRLGIVKTITAELRSIGDDTFREFRESCLGHFIREEWGGFVSNAALHALFSNEVVRPDAQVDEFWFRIGHRLIRFSRYEYALVIGLQFGDPDFDVHGDDVPPEGSVYDRYPLLSRGGQMLDLIRDRFAGGYFREQYGDAPKVSKVLCICYLIFGVDGGKRIADRWLWTLVEDQTRWESFPWGLYSYQILVTYLSDVPTEVPAGLDPGYHFYGNIYAIMIWACEAIPSLISKCGIMLGASFIQRPRCTRWKLKKLGHIDFTTFFDDEIDCFEVLSPTPEEEQEPYMQFISDALSERVQYTHRMALCKRGGRGRGKGKGRARDGDASVGDLARERIVRQRTSGPVISAPLYLTTRRESSGEPHDPVHTAHQRQSSPIRGPRQTASSSAWGTQETAPIINFDTLFTRLHTCIQSAVQEMRQYVDAVVEKSVKDVCRHIDELVRESASLGTPSWDFEGINELMRNSPIEPRFDGAPIHPDQTMSVPDAGRSSLPTETRVDGALSLTEQTEEVPSPGRAPVLVEHTSSLDHHTDGVSVVTERTRSLDHQSSVPIVTPLVIPTEILVTPPEIAPRTRPSSSTADLSPISLEYSSTTISADTYHSPRLQYRSYRPHSAFSTTVVRKRKDLDEETYRRCLDSGDRCRTFGCIYGILQFDPGFIGVRWLDDWAAQTVLVHTSFLATCINVRNNSKRKGGPLSIDDEDLDFLVSHIHGLRPFWGDHRPWWELREVLTIWNTSPESSCGHWLVLRIRLEEGIIIMHDSLAQEEDAYLKLRSHQSLGISFLIPTILQRSGFYERRLDITPAPHFRVTIAKTDLCYVQDDSTSCGALSIRTLESLVQHSFSQGKTAMDIYAFRGRMARAIWRFSDDADTVVCDPVSLFIRFDDRD
ncbi:hypothetical protein OROMI_012348 [Orobanche minor]